MHLHLEPPHIHRSLLEIPLHKAKHEIIRPFKKHLIMLVIRGICMTSTQDLDKFTL